MAKLTPGPWARSFHSNFTISAENQPHERIAMVYATTEGLANARLIAAAPDHASVASVLASGKVRWEPFRPSDIRGELCIDGMRYSTELDEFGVPKLDDVIRAAIARMEGR